MSGAFDRVIAWHMKRIAKLRREILKAEEWSAANNDGQRDLGGRMFTEEYPLEITVHERSIEAVKRLRRAARPAGETR
jgi:hypothetical protein